MIGRKSEIEVINEALNSKESEFIAVYGRRRVGKTYLIRNAFAGRIAFQHTGLANAGRIGQLEAFRASLSDGRLPGCPAFATWGDAFRALAKSFGRETGAKQVIFLDELSWMDTPKSGFTSALEHFWNAWASARSDIVLVVCGSVSSWIVRKVFNDHGGLHNRVTHRIRLNPFTLAECEEYAADRGLAMTRRQILDYYMAVGGIPFYWRLLRRGESVTSAIDRLCFSQNGELATEYNHLYASLFRNPERHLAVVNALAGKRAGLTHGEIAAATGTVADGDLSKTLEDLELCGFARRYQMPGRKTRDVLWQLMDNFTDFHNRFIAPNKGAGEGFWVSIRDSPAVRAWSGLAFERVCLQHVAQIKKALGISGVASRAFAWRALPDGEGHPGAQVDLVIDRDDRVANLCEMKCCSGPFEITKGVATSLAAKREAFRRVAGSGKALHLTMVTTEGIVQNAYARDIQSEVRLDDLFL